jgi:hypothetical protein
MPLILLAFLVQICFAGLDALDIAPVTIDNGIGINLDLGHGKIYDSNSYKKALIFLEELKDASSCHRLAASTLIQTCQSLDQKVALDVALAEVKEEYAAKVAVCELSAVFNKSKDVVPKACKAFVPSEKACAKTGAEAKRICYAQISRSQVTVCISGLETRAQTWTSYSNALQNVHNTCQASRISMDKGKFHALFSPTSN